MGSVQSVLMEWFWQHQRKLPWRGVSDPYKVLLAEVLLQQTRVEQAIPYYERFLERFPSLEALAKASQEEVLKAWQGCGYYARARNLHRLAQQVAAGGGFPKNYGALRSLPGIGPYTAAALASIAFGEPVAAVDGNVRRVLSRWYAWEKPTAGQIQQAAEALMAGPARLSPGDWNQALMELGATVCLPKNPACGRCPVARFCLGQAAPERYPAPKERKQRQLEWVALVLQGPGGVYLEQRQGALLGGLWGFPMEEGPGALGRLLARFGLEQAEWLGSLRHNFTHRKLRVEVYRAPWTAGENPAGRPLSRLDQKILALVEASSARSCWRPGGG